MRVTVVVLLVCFASLCVAVKKCTQDSDCMFSHFCAQKSASCTLKYAKFCNSDAECASAGIEMCAVQPDRERGTCIPDPYRALRKKFKPTSETQYIVDATGTKLELVEEIPHELLAQIPKSYGYDVDTQGHCGMDEEHFDLSMFQTITSPQLNQSNGCAKYTCENPTERDKYTTPPNKVINLHWIVIVGASYAETAREKISAATTLINQLYSSTGFSFRSYIASVSSSTYQSYSVGVFNCPANVTKCVNALVAMTQLRGTSWQSNKAFQILYMPCNPSNINGAALFPFYKEHGLVVMNPSAIGAGSTTLSHEMGHALGLWHTFHGISELEDGCNDCYENVASDSRGDFCSDTNPLPRNWVCGDPSVKEYPDPCNSARSSWTNTPYTNIMSYGNCRKVFTGQQVRRMRCWYPKFANCYSDACP